MLGSLFSSRGSRAIEHRLLLRRGHFHPRQPAQRDANCARFNRSVRSTKINVGEQGRPVPPRVCGARKGDCNAVVFVCQCVCGTRSVQSGSGGECSLRGVAAADLIDQPAEIDLVHHPAEPDGCAGASSQAGQRASRSPSKVPSRPEKCCYVSGWRWGGSAKVWTLVSRQTSTLRGVFCI